MTTMTVLRRLRRVFPDKVADLVVTTSLDGETLCESLLVVHRPTGTVLIEGEVRRGELGKRLAADAEGALMATLVDTFSSALKANAL